MHRILAALLLLLAPQLAADEVRIEKLLSEMTLQEKLGQLTMYAPDQPELKDALAKGLVGSVLNTAHVRQANELQSAQLAGSKHRIPILFAYDVLHGYRTIFPIPLAVASSFDPEAAETVGAVSAREAREDAIRWTFAPMVDIARDARWGRMAEGSGEDPYLAGRMAAAYVRGFQSNGLLACAKHFVAYGAAEGGRDYGHAEVTEATLRNVYLPPFRAAVDAGVGSLMSAFNTVGDVPATANRKLLQDVLRSEWGFQGLVVSDWAAVSELVQHGIAATPAEAARKAFDAGVDIDMWDGAFMTLPASARIDEAVRRVLRAKFAAGLFEEPLVREPVVVSTSYRDARHVARRSIVLLKNDGGLLPLSKSRKIALAGPLAESSRDMLGPWHAKGSRATSVRDGLHLAGVETVRPIDADVIVAVFGETHEQSGEAASRTSLALPPDQQRQLESLVELGKPVVLIVMSGRPLAISWAAEHVPSIVQAWFLGSEGGNAIADVLFGDVNPSGKLPVSVPRTAAQAPVYYAHFPTGRPAGHRFTNRYQDIPVGPLYPFGHGLSYTTFEYSDLRVEGDVVSATIRNSGTRAGDEIVQFYVRDVVASVSRPVKELKGFQRVSLRPDQSVRVEFPLTRRELEFWTNGAWVVEPGEFQVWIAPSSEGGLTTKVYR
ncbi:MAG TPA: glycoside hydrolase family 3 N-terminal domain-containing protein [Thermoanaerobaculia bacterium]|nr:glycoside hydrolase family 3 N-terminal domain-containing protein [Thermoanaerobaculia bacterium]